MTKTKSETYSEFDCDYRNVIYEALATEQIYKCFPND